MYDNKFLLRAMSSYLSEELGYKVTVTDFTEVTRTLCDSGCWEEIRVWMSGVDQHGNIVGEEYCDEMSEFIRELEKHSYLTAWDSSDSTPLEDVRNFARVATKPYYDHYPAIGDWPGGYRYDYSTYKVVQTREYTIEEKAAAYDRDERLANPCTKKVETWWDRNNKHYGQWEWL